MGGQGGGGEDRKSREEEGMGKKEKGRGRKRKGRRREGGGALPRLKQNPGYGPD